MMRDSFLSYNANRIHRYLTVGDAHEMVDDVVEALLFPSITELLLFFLLSSGGLMILSLLEDDLFPGSLFSRSSTR